jgi:hypothetical protein
VGADEAPGAAKRRSSCSSEVSCVDMYSGR